MLKLRVTGDDGGHVAMFGLSAMNLTKLQEDNPIHVDMKKHMAMTGQVYIRFEPAANGRTGLLLEKKSDTYIAIVNLPRHGIERLQAGHMLEYDLAPAGFRVKLVIFAGATEDTMMQQLVDGGFVLADTATGTGTAQ